MTFLIDLIFNSAWLNINFFSSYIFLFSWFAILIFGMSFSCIICLPFILEKRKFNLKDKILKLASLCLFVFLFAFSMMSSLHLESKYFVRDLYYSYGSAVNQKIPISKTQPLSLDGTGAHRPVSTEVIFHYLDKPITCLDSIYKCNEYLNNHLSEAKRILIPAKKEVGKK